jgi:single-strand DNA-binding protein
MINKVTLVGRLGRDPEMHYTPQGTTVTTFPLATERSWKDESGADHTETTWHSIVTRDKLAEICNTQLTKGQMVYLEGRLHNRAWEDERQIQHYSTEVIAEEVKFLDSQREEAHEEPPA